MTEKQDEVREEQDGGIDPEGDMMKQEEEPVLAGGVRDSFGESVFMNIEQSMMELQQSIENLQQN